MLQRSQTIGEVVIVGGGPVGNFSAVLAAMLGIKCVVYQKRAEYTRQINLKIEKDFFKNVSKVFQRISRRKRTFLKNLNDKINEKNGKILLKDLQTALKQQAQDLGVKYEIGKEIKSFEQVSNIHQHNFPIILDCAGRRSQLRENEFGTDEKNMQIYNLHYALHINFKAEVSKRFDHRLLYPVLKNSQNLKLGQIIVSKKKEKEEGNYSHVTVPLFISDQLSDIIDKNYPEINRVPLKPFSVKLKQSMLVKQVQQVIHTLFCALVMQDWDIDWSSVVLKKIDITCGYALRRSYDRYVSLGDSAAHFAYFKSLNFGLSHTFQFFKILSSYPNLRCQLGPFDEKVIVNRCWKKNPHLWPIKAREGPSPCQYFVITQQIKILSPFLYDARDDSAKIINILPFIFEQKIEQVFQDHRKSQKEKNWVSYLQKFQNIRKFDINNEILSNKNKKVGSEVISYFIWLNSLSPLKVSETFSLMTNGYFLNRKDFEYFSDVLKSMKDSLQNWNHFTSIVNERVQALLDSKTDKFPQYEKLLNQLSIYCSKRFIPRQFCQMVSKFKQIKKENKNKKLILLSKALQIIAHIILKQLSEQQELIENSGEDKPKMRKLIEESV